MDPAPHRVGVLVLRVTVEAGAGDPQILIATVDRLTPGGDRPADAVGDTVSTAEAAIELVRSWLARVAP